MMNIVNQIVSSLLKGKEIWLMDQHGALDERVLEDVRDRLQKLVHIGELDDNQFANNMARIHLCEALPHKINRPNMIVKVSVLYDVITHH